MAEEGTKIEGEGEGSSLSPQVVNDKQVEKARSKGWRPLEEFKGDPADWVDYGEFLGRQKLFDKIHDLKNQLSRQASKFESDMTRIQQHFTKVQEVEYQRAKEDLKRQLAAAKQEGDVEAVAEIAGQIKEVDAEIKEAKQEAKVAAKGGPTPEFVEWQERNEWFQKDAEMTADAIAIGTGYAAANPGKSQAEVLDYTEKKVKRMYPEKFEGSEPKGKVKVEDKVEGGGNVRPAPKKKGQLTVGDLNDVERSIMNTLIKRNALKDVANKNKRTQQEEYLAQLAERKQAAGEM